MNTLAAELVKLAEALGGMSNAGNREKGRDTESAHGPKPNGRRVASWLEH